MPRQVTLVSTTRRRLLAFTVLAPFFHREANAFSVEIDEFRRNAINSWRRRIKGFLTRKIVPIIDTEATYNTRINLDWIRAQMDSEGVAQVCFAPHAALGSGTSRKLYDTFPDYFIPTTADGSSLHWYRNTQSFAESTRGDLLSGRYFLMGEFELRHYPSSSQFVSGQLDRDVTVSLDDPSVHDVFRLAEESGVAFQIHYEVEDALLTPLEAILGKYPRANVIWCHLGQIRYSARNSTYGPDYVRGLIARFPNLQFDLGIARPDWIYPGSREYDSTIFQADTGRPPHGGYLRSNWRDLIDAFPERFIAATDIDAGRFQSFPYKIRLLRDLILSQVSTRASHLIAYQNAWRLISREPWVD